MRTVPGLPRHEGARPVKVTCTILVVLLVLWLFPSVNAEEFHTASVDDLSKKIDQVSALLTGNRPHQQPGSDTGLPGAAEPVTSRFSSLPYSFIPNAGQAGSPGVAFMVERGGSEIYFTQQEMILVQLAGEPGNETAGVLRQSFVGADSDVLVEGTAPLPGTANYFIGNDSARWLTNLSTYGGIVYRDLYPGIDLRYYGDNERLKREFVISPGASPSAIRLRYTGAAGITIDDAGSLLIATSAGTIAEAPPVCYQTIDGLRTDVPAWYVLQKDGDVTFSIGIYDPAYRLVIDPQLIYSTFLGGANDEYGNSIVADSSGYAYVTGKTASSDFPNTTGAFSEAFQGNTDVFVTKLNPDGSGLVYSTFIGGAGDEYGYGIRVDGTGNAYVTGFTLSSGFPNSTGAFQGALQGGFDAFVTKLDPTGSGLVYSTFLGGTGDDIGYGIAVDSSGNVSVTGSTTSSDFPNTTGAFSQVYMGVSDAFVTRLNQSGSLAAYSTFLGGGAADTGKGIALDGSGNAYVTGYTESSDFPNTTGAFSQANQGGGDAFVSKLCPTGSVLTYSTFIGGAGEDDGYGITLDGSGNAYVTGYTLSSDFPNTTGAFSEAYQGGGDAFVLELNPSGSVLAYSTFLGGAIEDGGIQIAIDSSGNAYVAGYTLSPGFPNTTGAFSQAFQGGIDAFVAKLNPSGSVLLYSTFLGGTGDEYGNSIAVDTSGNAFVTGKTTSPGFPNTTGAFSQAWQGNYDAFVLKLPFNAAPVAGFTASPTTGPAPLTVQFTDTSTGGVPDSWNWSFGDGGYSSVQNPLHTYTAAGAYTVSLNASNSAGSGTKTVSNFITVTVPQGAPPSGESYNYASSGPAVQQQPAPAPAPAPVGTGAQSYAIGVAGLSFQPDATGAMTLSINYAAAQQAGAIIDVYDTFVTIYHRGSPGVLLTFFGDRFSLRDGVVSGRVKRATFRTDPLEANMTYGAVDGYITAEMFSLPQGARVNTSISEQVSEDLTGQFFVGARRNGLALDAVAYTFDVQKQNFAPTGAANVTLSVPAPWVDGHGGKDVVRIARISSGAGGAEMINTTYTGLDARGNMVFRGDSPNGTSVFGLITATATAAKQKEAPNLTVQPVSKPAITFDIGMFTFFLSIAKDNPVIMVVVIAVVAAVAWYGWRKRRRY